MIDFIKLKVNDPLIIEKIRNNSRINFKAQVSLDTAEAEHVYHAQYKTLRFELEDYPNRKTLYIRGSLPKYATGVNNCINMPITEAWHMLQKIATEFYLGIHTTEVIK